MAVRRASKATDSTEKPDPASTTAFLDRLIEQTPAQQQGLRSLFAGLRDQIAMLAERSAADSRRRADLEAKLRRAVARARPKWGRRVALGGVLAASFGLNIYFFSVAYRMGDLWSVVEYDVNRAFSAVMALADGGGPPPPAPPPPPSAAPVPPSAAPPAQSPEPAAAAPSAAAETRAAMEARLGEIETANADLRRRLAAAQSRAAALDRKLKARVAAESAPGVSSPKTATAAADDSQRAIAARAAERERTLREGVSANVLARVAEAPRIRYVYVVQPGDTLEAIGLRFGVSVQSLLDVNQTRADILDGALDVGDRINIPG